MKLKIKVQTALFFYSYSRLKAALEEIQSVVQHTREERRNRYGPIGGLGSGGLGTDERRHRERERHERERERERERNEREKERIER